MSENRFQCGSIEGQRQNILLAKFNDTRFHSVFGCLALSWLSPLPISQPVFPHTAMRSSCLLRQRLDFEKEHSWPFDWIKQTSAPREMMLRSTTKRYDLFAWYLMLKPALFSVKSTFVYWLRSHLADYIYGYLRNPRTETTSDSLSSVMWFMDAALS